MRFRLTAVLILALLVLAPSVTLADLAPYSQDFEGLLESSLDQPDQLALNQDGWLAFVNGFGPDWSLWYSYGPFPAPNGGFGGAAFSAVVAGEGGAEQGAQQLVVFSDYNNGNHGDGSNAIIETNVFQEQVVGAADVGSTWYFEFDAKRGNIEGASQALAFFKTLDPANGFALTNFITADLTATPAEWVRYSLAIAIDASLEGQILQFGFLNYASNYAGSGVFYDNVNFFTPVVGACCTPFACEELPIGECVGQYAGDGTSCDEQTCEGPLFFTVCHVPPGNPDNTRTITVGYAAAQDHLAHGDHPGPCAIRVEPNLADSVSGASVDGATHLQDNAGIARQETETPAARTLRPARVRDGARDRN